MSLINRLRLMKRRLEGTSKPARIAPASTPRTFEGYCFIAGMHRSGTTLVEHHLNARADVTVLRGDVPENEGQHLQDVVPAGRVHGGPGRFAFAPAMHTDPVDHETARAQQHRLLCCWTPWMQGSGPVLLEKSPPSLVRIPWLRSVFPGARFLIVTRHPVANALATQKWSKTSLQELVYHWHVAHSAALAAAEGHADCIFLRYEDLCADPEGVLTRLLSDLGLTARDSPAAISPRFAEICDTNHRYLAGAPRHAWGPGAWDPLGYGLDIR